MKQILSAISVLALFACTSCGNSSENTNTASTDTAKATQDTIAAAEVKPAFKPFEVVEIVHTVKDFSKWKPAFDADSTARKESGLGFIVIGKNQANPNNLLIALSAADLQKAKDFAASPRLKDLMKKNGVISKPELSYFHVIRFTPDSTKKQWVTVTHKVKDFEAWLKVFDAEGTATRAGFGLSDAVLSQAIGDSNTVHIVFDITDMAKAKARMNDPALKKLMTDAGVIGAPRIVFYNED
ncbi:MAG TPA: hypothetical protein VK622_08875 [Puia sp.]|nr:hypothetical protein [Puia sp.]